MLTAATVGNPKKFSPLTLYELGGRIRPLSNNNFG